MPGTWALISIPELRKKPGMGEGREEGEKKVGEKREEDAKGGGEREEGEGGRGRG